MYGNTLLPAVEHYKKHTFRKRTTLNGLWENWTLGKDQWQTSHSPLLYRTPWNLKILQMRLSLHLQLLSITCVFVFSLLLIIFLLYVVICVYFLSCMSFFGDVRSLVGHLVSNFGCSVSPFGYFSTVYVYIMWLFGHYCLCCHSFLSLWGFCFCFFSSLCGHFAYLTKLCDLTISIKTLASQ